jgi:hypothetical protein
LTVYVQQHARRRIRPNQGGTAPEVEQVPDRATADVCLTVDDLTGPVTVHAMHETDSKTADASNVV